MSECLGSKSEFASYYKQDKYVSLTDLKSGNANCENVTPLPTLLSCAVHS